ncbi:uncharacterized protein MKK02DRAFT_41143 [Dioszegia hungarica]|uniref:CENP-V/GFA domain-containing protein n=1 Tax=Dioszegia hungarica TaxID=4972 RepID=A0AA38H4X2_9TREE|nr:uncharacterized protein MKK02DRAFT_41143 [Dioszegia hungarica]KAI9632831.1 hypothetical protein MKK02DRAFT_41143 [Dioszegia hungarica]
MTSDTDTVTGHCVCKAYTVTIPRPTQMNLCHCVDCRRWAGSMRYSAHVGAPADKVKLEGPKPRTHSVKGVDGENMIRACGLYIMPESRAEKGPSFFKAGAKLMFVGLFNPGDVPTPTMETFTKDMESWETTARGVNAFEKNGKF